MSTVYQVNKGVNRPIEFRGFKAQYIGFLAGGLVGLLLLFAILYICGLSLYLCLPIIFALGAALFILVGHMSRKYGQHGLLKKMAKGRIPDYLKFKSRKPFLNLIIADDEAY